MYVLLPSGQRTNGTCRCGHTGVLPGRIDGHPACRACTGVVLNVDCWICGAEAELHSSGRCWRCTLIDEVDFLLNDANGGGIPPALEPLADAPRRMPRANSGLTWLRQPHVQRFLRDLVAQPEITHERLDDLPSSRTRDHVRGLLVEHGVLPHRDELKVRYQEWSRKALRRVARDEDRALVERYVKWHHMRRMNQMETVSNGTFSAEQADGDCRHQLSQLAPRPRRRTSADVQQAHLDQWVNAGPATHLVVDRFLHWAIRTGLAPSGVTVARHRRGTSRKLSAEHQEQVLADVIEGSGLNHRDRAAAILVLVAFGQPIERVVGIDLG